MRRWSQQPGRSNERVACDVCGKQITSTRHPDVPDEQPDYCTLECLLRDRQEQADARDEPLEEQQADVQDDQDEEDLLLACPACDSASIHKVTGKPTGSQPDHGYYCSSCLEKFDEPLERERKGHGVGIHSEHAQALIDADPDEIMTDGGRDQDPEAVSALFSRLAELAIADGDVPEDGSGYDGVWTREVEAPDRDRNWRVALNADVEDDADVRDWPRDGDKSTIPAGRAVIQLRAWPVGMISPFGGQLAAEELPDGPRSIEDELLRDLETALIEAGDDVDRTVPVDLDAAEEVDS